MKKKRMRMGVAPKMLPLTVILPVLLCIVSLSGAWVEEKDIPVPSQGDIIFYADVVTFYDGPGRNTEDVYCVVLNDQIKFTEADGGYGGKLRYHVEVSDESGEVIETIERKLEVSASSSEDAVSRSVVQVLQSELTIPPGRYKMKIKIEDLNARKTSIISYLFGKFKTGEIEIQVNSKQFRAGSIAMSDIEFARKLRRTSEGDFQKSGLEVIPNAQRKYGLLLPELAIFFEVYDFREDRGTDTLTASYSIINKSGIEIFRNEEPLVLRENRSASTALFDITSLAAGSYLLSLTVAGNEGRTIASSDRKFDIVWSVWSWGKHESETIEEMAYILTEDEMETFRSLSLGDREGFLRDFWLELDPTPGTAENEALEEHFRRVRYADSHFGGANSRGALSDRGRIYVKYGPADDVKSYYSDYEFVKGTRDIEGLDTPIPTDPFSRSKMKTGAGDVPRWDRTSSEADAHSDQRGGATVHGKAYEVWTYDGLGDPVRKLYNKMRKTAIMRFIFVDEKGVGEYKIVYSTEKEEY